MAKVGCDRNQGLLMRQFKSSRSTGEIWFREDFSLAVNHQSVVALGLMMQQHAN